tara:strand:+ start:86 stop:847 length:762 start_codon:yes stop_codon:yes gene_type:complete
MNSVDLEFILVLLIFISFVLILINKKNNNKNSKFVNWLGCQARSFLPILIIVLFLRSFIAEPFRIPSGSMIPTLLIGDYILVNKYKYGIRMPITKSKVFKISSPSKGDVVVFRYPGNEKINFIKRVIGVPGDIVRYEDKNIYVNNIIYKKSIKKNHEYLREFQRPEIELYSENNNDKVYNVLNDNMSPSTNGSYVVPKGKYFVMGDNRDHSSDSRYWGFVPEENLVGKAFMIWMSFNSNTYSFKYKRIGHSIK